MCSELVIDWTKHAFITKFNNIPPSVYQVYIDRLVDEFVGSDSNQTSAAMGFMKLPLACLVIKITYQTCSMLQLF